MSYSFVKKATAFLFAITIGLSALTDTFGQGRFSIAPTVTPGYRTMNFVGKSSRSESVGSGHYQTFGIGLSGYCSLSSYWSVSAGLMYNRFTGNETFSYQTGFRVDESEITTDNIQLPILINYIVSGHRLSPYLSFGAALNYTSADPIACHTIAQLLVDDPIFIPDSPKRVIRIQPMIGAGVHYQLTPTVALIVQPTAGYELGKPSTDYAHYRVYQFSLQTQVKFSF